jgi:GNAT superfamily N-acetyltransferase
MGEEFLGRIAVKHRLTDRLREVGGHIGYDVRPTARRRGHATAVLAAALLLAHDLGIEPGAGHVRPRQRGVAAGDRGHWRPVRRRARRQVPVLGADGATGP